MMFPKGLTHKFCLKIEILVKKKKKTAIVFTEVLHQYKDLHDWKEYLFHQVVIFGIFPKALTSYYNKKLSPAFCLIHVPN